MALSLQRKLELAGDLAKVQPLLQRLHILEKPEPKRHRVRNGLLAIGAIAAVVAVIGFVGRRRFCQDSAGPGDVEAGAAMGAPGAEAGERVPELVV